MSGGGSQFRVLTKLERQAHVLAGGSRRVFTQAELKLARHMAQDGASFVAIGAALGWQGSMNGLRSKLIKFNIWSRNRAGRVGAHFGVSGAEIL